MIYRSPTFYRLVSYQCRKPISHKSGLLAASLDLPVIQDKLKSSCKNGLVSSLPDKSCTGKTNESEGVEEVTFAQ